MSALLPLFLHAPGADAIQALVEPYLSTRRVAILDLAGYSHSTSHSGRPALEELPATIDAILAT